MACSLSILSICSSSIRGIDADTLKSKLEEQSKDEMNHAKMVANRIIQLGGTPTTKLTDTSTCDFCTT